MFSWSRKILLVGMGCRVGKYCEIEPNVDVGFRPNLEIGNRCQINQNTVLKSVIIGDNVMIAPNVVLLDRSHHYERLDIPMIDQGETSRELTIIADDVWIGQNAIILPGLKVGKGAIIGAGSVVTHDVSDWAVVAGVPAKVIKSRQDNL